MIAVFTNAFKGNATDEIAINSEIVVSIFPTMTDDNKKVTNIYTLNEKTFTVEESYKVVIGRLNGSK